MAKLNPAHGNWLYSMMSTLGVPKDHTPAPPAPPVDGGSVGRLSREACALPELFALARPARDGGFTSNGRGAGDSALAAEAIEQEQRRNAGRLAPLAQKLRSCREALTEAVPRLLPQHRSRLEDALRTLETEYVRLCDAERFYFDRRLRQVRTGQVDDDPEFTFVLERVVYSTDRGDDVAASVGQAVQTIAAVLVAYVREQE
jgi:hypothetical protein